MKILITGINGFVGSNLVSAFKNLHTLFGLDIIASQTEGITNTYNWNELEQIPSSDAIIHLAGKAHDTKNTSDAQSYFDINVGLTKKIFDYFLSSDAKKFIFFSSVKAAADTVPNILTEDQTPEPKTPYGQSKLEAEQYILSQKLPEDKKVYIFRPAMIHGPGNKGNLNLLYRVVKKGIPWPLGSFKNKRSMVSIDNLIFIIKEILEKDIPSGIYQIADDQPVSTNEVIELMARSLKKKPRIMHLPKTGIQLLAKIGDLLYLPLNSERLKKLTESYVVSNAKLKEALGIERLPVDSKEGLSRTFEHFQ